MNANDEGQFFGSTASTLTVTAEKPDDDDPNQQMTAHPKDDSANNDIDMMAATTTIETTVPTIATEKQPPQMEEVTDTATGVVAERKDEEKGLAPDEAAAPATANDNNNTASESTSVVVDEADDPSQKEKSTTNPEAVSREKTQASTEGGRDGGVTAKKTDDGAAAKNKTRTSSATRTRRWPFWAVRSSPYLQGPAIFVKWEDCAFYLKQQEDDDDDDIDDTVKAVYRGFDHLEDACAYIEKVLPQDQKAKKKRKSTVRSTTSSSSAKKKSQSDDNPTPSTSRKRKAAPKESTNTHGDSTPAAADETAATSEEGEGTSTSTKRKRRKTAGTTPKRARTKQAQEKWDSMLKLLPQFHAKYGHYDINHERKDPEFAGLETTVQHLKEEIDLYNTNPETSRLTPQEYSYFDSIGMIHSLRITLPFDRKTAQWKRFFLENGTFHITTVNHDRLMFDFSKRVANECKKIVAGETQPVVTPARSPLPATPPAEGQTGDDGGEGGGETNGDAAAPGAASTVGRNNEVGTRRWKGPLTQAQYQHLESIGLVQWLRMHPNERTVMRQQDNKLTDRWQQNFEAAHRFYQEHGRLPKSTEDKKLFYWILRQKKAVLENVIDDDTGCAGDANNPQQQAKKKRTHGIIFTPKQIGQLSLIGVTFKVKKYITLEERAIEWFDYVREHNGKHPLANIPIGKWAMDQRKKYQIWQETGNPSNLTQEFVDKMAAGGFPWVLTHKNR